MHSYPERHRINRNCDNFHVTIFVCSVGSSAAIGYSFPVSYCLEMPEKYRTRRVFITGRLRDASFSFEMRQGTYCFFTDFSKLRPGTT